MVTGLDGTPYHLVIGYAYEADLHCVDCTKKRFGDPIPEDATDREGNPISAELAGYESEDRRVCGDCFEWLEDE